MGGDYEQSRRADSGYDQQDHSVSSYGLQSGYVLTWTQFGARVRRAVKVSNYVFNMPWHCQYWTLQQIISTTDEKARREKAIL